MTIQTKPEQSGDVIKMTQSQIAFSLGEVFCILDKTQKETKVKFLQDLVEKISNVGLYGSFKKASLEYDAQPVEDCMLLMGNAVADLICTNENYKKQFKPHARTMFADKQQASDFLALKKKHIEVEKERSHFNFKDILKKKPISEKILDQSETNMLNLLQGDHFTRAISYAGQGVGLKELEERIHEFAVQNDPLHQVYHEEKAVLTHTLRPTVFDKQNAIMPVYIKN